MFFGVSPMGMNYPLSTTYGKGGKRGKYRSYSYTGKDHRIYSEDSIGTKDISSLVRHSEQMYFGASNKK